MRIDWQKRDAMWVATIGNITLCASPDRTKGFHNKPVRGTKWHAQVSHWNESTRTMSRYGRDVYMHLCDSAKEAMLLAEQVYNEELASRKAALRLGTGTGYIFAST